DYKRRFGGELPSQAATNLQAIQSAQTQIQAIAESADRARERRLLLERQVIDLESPDPLMVVANVPTLATATRAEGIDKQLEIAKARLQELLTHDKPDHPDVRAVQRQIGDLEAKLANENSKPVQSVPDRPASTSERLRQQRVRELKAQIEETDRQIVQK